MCPVKKRRASEMENIEYIGANVAQTLRANRCTNRGCHINDNDANPIIHNGAYWLLGFPVTRFGSPKRTPFATLFLRLHFVSLLCLIHNRGAHGHLLSVSCLEDNNSKKLCFAQRYCSSSRNASRTQARHHKHHPPTNNEPSTNEKMDPANKTLT